MQHRPAVIFIAYPNNPTGNLFDRGGIEAILRAAPGIVVIDEAYLPFAQDTWMPLLKRTPNLLVLRTLSKLGLAGIRLGYLAADADWIEQFEKLRPPYNVNVLTLAAADLMLENMSILDAQAGVLRQERGKLLSQLQATPGVRAFDSAANFILFRVANADTVFAASKAARCADQECDVDSSAAGRLPARYSRYRRRKRDFHEGVASITRY